MKLILVMVTSLDGKSTKHNAPGAQNIASSEDSVHFQKIIENASLIIMGSTTYDNHKNIMKHKEGTLRVIVTHHPERYENEKIPGQLEFTNETPSQLIKRLEQQGYTEGYLVGGAHTNTEFFKQNLVTELWQTIEPRIVGVGLGMVGEEEIDIRLKLLSSEKLNDNGTLLLKYLVLPQ